MRTYLPRIADGILAKALASSGAVQIRSPKWCGKRATGSRAAASLLYMQDPDHQRQYLALADSKPLSLLEGATPRLIDEWQMAPQLWDAVRFTVDQRGLPGQFILTGSSPPTIQGAHSGVGRIERFTMQTMSLFESKESNGQVSLASLFDGAVDIGAVSSPCYRRNRSCDVPGRLARCRHRSKP